MTTTTPPCPDCGAPTRERVSNIPGILRWFSCTKYPACKGKVREYAKRAAAPAAPAPKVTIIDELAKVPPEMWDAARVLPLPAATPPAPKRTPSKYQQAIFDWIRTGTGNAVVEAVAGSGKTTTMVDALALTTGRVLFSAFNASIAKELAERAPSHVTVSTLHALGLKAVKRAYPGVQVDKDGEKLQAACLAAFPEKPGPNGDENFDIRRLAIKAAALAKATLTPTSDTAALVAMMDRYGIEPDQAEDATRIATALRNILATCASDTTRIDFDDMVWLPVVLELSVDKYDWVFIDETQDMNRNQLELIMRATRSTTRVVCVGDRAQSIYGFRGADTTAIPSIIERLNATVFPLSITYRCPASHVRAAAELVPAIEARPDAPEGSITDLMLDKATPLMQSGDLVMCRTNAPLASVAFALIREGKKAVIRGREIGTGLMSLVRKLAGRRGATIADLMPRMRAHHDKEGAKLRAMKRPTLALDDKMETLAVLCEGCDDSAALLNRIQSIFSDDAGAGVICSSVHRAKGLEAPRTFILRPELMPHPSAKKDWELEQERNIRYVALTRSKDAMYMVSMPKEL
jgi:DNA helicase-2/ATP-dependent DNA helicase PcrA